MSLTKWLQISYLCGFKSLQFFSTSTQDSLFPLETAICIYYTIQLVFHPYFFKTTQNLILSLISFLKQENSQDFSSYTGALSTLHKGALNWCKLSPNNNLTLLLEDSLTKQKPKTNPVHYDNSCYFKFP